MIFRDFVKVIFSSSTVLLENKLLITDNLDDVEEEHAETWMEEVREACVETIGMIDDHLFARIAQGSISDVTSVRQSKTNYDTAASMQENIRAKELEAQLKSRQNAALELEKDIKAAEEDLKKSKEKRRLIQNETQKIEDEIRSVQIGRASCRERVC